PNAIDGTHQQRSYRRLRRQRAADRAIRQRLHRGSDGVYAIRDGGDGGTDWLLRDERNAESGARRAHRVARHLIFVGQDSSLVIRERMTRLESYPAKCLPLT